MKYNVRVVDLDEDQIIKFNNKEDLVNFVTENQHVQIILEKFHIHDLKETFKEFLDYWIKNGNEGKAIFYNIEITTIFGEN